MTDALRDALEPFAKLAEFVSDDHRDSRPIMHGLSIVLAERLTIGHLRAAKAALTALAAIMTPETIYLRDVGTEEDQCWVVCAKGDPGAVVFESKAHLAATPADVLERIAREHLSDPATDDLTVPLAIELSDMTTRAFKAEAALRAATPAVGGEVLKHTGPPFSVYHNGNEVGDKNGHVCTAEDANIATDIVAALNLAAQPASSPAVGGERGMIANKAREWAGHYTPHSDGWNTFILFAEWVESLPASPLRGSVNDKVREIVYQMAPADQYDLAFKVAENVGYTLVRESEHPDSPHLSASPPEQPDSERDSIFDMCVMIVEEECYLDDPNGPIFKTGLAIRDRIKCAQRNRDKES